MLQKDNTISGVETTVAAELVFPRAEVPRGSTKIQCDDEEFDRLAAPHGPQFAVPNHGPGGVSIPSCWPTDPVTQRTESSDQIARLIRVVELQVETIDCLMSELLRR